MDLFTTQNQSWHRFSSCEKKFSNGDTIAEAHNRREWSTFFEQHTPCYWVLCVESKDVYFYNYFAVNDKRGIGMDGFRIPNLDDHDKLINELGGWNVPDRSLILNSGLNLYNELNGNIDGMQNHVGLSLYGAWWLKVNNSKPGFYGAYLPKNLSLCFAINKVNNAESYWRRPTYINFGYQIRLMKDI
jgi:hypothetical protein